MEIISQKTKKIMEECKVRAKVAGLEIKSDTLEYIVTNQELIELRSKAMIPTLYDYWVDDVEVIRDKWMYQILPHNAYETVINTRPVISFYNDNNPDWLNVMIFYHVLGHIDFFQNNVFFKKTWDDDFCGQALADKRLVNRIRQERGAEKRWVDYVIEFARSVDNLVGYYKELEANGKDQMQNLLGTFSEKANFYFGEFFRKLYDKGTVQLKFYYEEIERYNRCLKQFGPERGEEIFFGDYDFRSKFPEFNSIFEKYQQKEAADIKDIMQYVTERSEFLNREANKWMKDVIHVVRKTSLYFQPQIRDKICSEGWASLWHERLFIADERIRGHEVNFAKINAGVLVNPRLGFNPYVIGKLLFEFIEELAGKGKLSYGFKLIKDAEMRKRYDQNLGPEHAKDILFGARKNLNDFLLINFLSDDDFQDFMDKHNLFVAGFRLNPEGWWRGYADIYIKSRSGKEYRKMLNKYLYHPPYVVVNEEKSGKGELYLDHVFEGRQLVTRYIPAVLIGLAFFWGNTVKLETTEFEIDDDSRWLRIFDPYVKPEYRKLRVLYTCEGKQVEKTILRSD